MIRSIAEVLKAAGTAKDKEDKMAILADEKNNRTPVLRNILILTYDKNYNIMLPSERPPYTPAPKDYNHGALYREGRKLKYFVEGQGGEKLSRAKRETLFVELLESVNPDDAEVLCQMIERKPFQGITASLINEAFGRELISKQKPGPKPKKDKQE